MWVSACKIHYISKTFMLTFMHILQKNEQWSSQLVQTVIPAPAKRNAAKYSFSPKTICRWFVIIARPITIHWKPLAFTFFMTICHHNYYRTSNVRIPAVVTVIMCPNKKVFEVLSSPAVFQVSKWKWKGLISLQSYWKKNTMKSTYSNRILHYQKQVILVMTLKR